MISLRTSSLVLFFTTIALGCSSSSSSPDDTGAAGTSSTGGSGTGGSATGGKAGTGGTGTGGTATAGSAGTGTGGTAAAGMGGGTAGTAAAGAAGAAGAGTGGAGGGKAGAAGSSTGGAAGTGGGTNNNTFDTAQTIMYDDGTGTNLVATELAPPTTDVDYYKFVGKKGDPLFIYTQCKPSTAPYDPTYPDLVMTLFNEAKTQIANDDDSPQTNDPSLYTVLPADGTYYLRIQECNNWDKGGPMNCAPAAAITTGSYGVAVVLLDPKGATNVPEVEPNDMAATATKVKYAAASAGQYYTSVEYGGFSAAADVDMYSFTLPMDVKVTEGRSTGYFNWFPDGVDGSGSTTQFGEAAIYDPADMVNAVAKIPDGSVGNELSPPLTLGKPYLLVVKRGAKMGANDFYFVTHFTGGSNPLEKEKAPGANDTVATGEATTAQDNADGSQTFFVEGDISTPADIDYYTIAVKAGLNQVAAYCAAEGSGSGLRMTKVELFADGVAIPKGSANDTFDKNMSITALALPAGAAKVSVKLSAPAVDPTVTSTFYRCGISITKK